MARPIVGAATERLYLLLPEFYRTADIKLDYPLLRFLATLGDQASEAQDIIDAWYSTGSLVDPVLGDADWLDWQAQLVGVDLDPDMTEQEKRDAINGAPSGWRAGSKGALADAAKTTLTGSKYAKVYDHSTDVPGTIGTAGEFDVLLVTRASETPDAAATLASVIRKGAKPAGVILYHRSYEASWSAIATAFPTWAAWGAAGSWASIMEAGLT